MVESSDLNELEQMARVAGFGPAYGALTVRSRTC